MNTLIRKSSANQPGLGAVHVNRPLTNISTAYIQNAAAFIALRVFPRVPVSKKADSYYTYDKSFWFRSQAQKRAPGNESAGSGYGLGTGTYNADVVAFHKDVADQIRANADAALSMDRDATEFVTRNLLIYREKEWATKYFQTGVWATDVTGVAASPSGAQFLQWDNASSTPVEDVETGRLTVLENTGFEPNVMVVSRAVHSVLKNHPDIIDRIKYGQTAGGPAMITPNALAALFEVDEYIVSSAVEDTAAEGATPSMQFIAGKHAGLFYRPPTPGLLTPAAGYTFSWTGLLGAGAEGTAISRFRMENLKADRIEGETAFDMRVIGSDLGYFLATAVA